jgi:hypothetical protein
LAESKKAIKDDYQKTNGEGSNLKILQGKLFLDLRKGLIQEEGAPVFPHDRIKKALKRQQRDIRRNSAKLRIEQVNRSKQMSIRDSRMERSNVTNNFQNSISPRIDNLPTASYVPTYNDQPNQHLNSTIR